MARVLKDSLAQVQVREVSRTCYIEILCEEERRGNYPIRFHRETVSTVDGQRVNASRRVITRYLFDIAPRTVELANGMILTGAQVAEAISRFGDVFEEEEASALQPEVEILQPAFPDRVEPPPPESGPFPPVL